MYQLMLQKTVMVALAPRGLPTPPTNIFLIPPHEQSRERFRDQHRLALGLDPNKLTAAQAEGTQGLPGLDLDLGRSHH
jgi:hypothetical protein